MAVSVTGSRFWPVAGQVLVEVVADDLVGREKAVFDALPQRVGVNRLTEVIDVGDVFCLLRRGGQPDLRCAGEVFKDFAPG